MIAFHGDQKIKNKYVQRVRSHEEKEEIIHGKYWENGKGCAVGCTIHSADHLAYERELGIPVAVARLQDILFEGMQNDNSKQFPRQFLSAIKPGTDLSLIPWKFLYWLQNENLQRAVKEKMSINVITAIHQCIDILAALEAGEKINQSDAWNAAWFARSTAWFARPAADSARSAASSAESAAWFARSAACSAEFAADSAEFAARSVAYYAKTAAEFISYKKMADKLIALLQAAPRPPPGPPIRTWKCHRCGEQNQPNRKSCWNCKTRRFR